MRLKKIQLIAFSGLLFLVLSGQAQVPTANFSVSPNPLCSGNTFTITDLSTNSPNAWSYSIHIGGGPGPGITNVLTTQSPTFTAQNPGVYTISLVSTNGSGSSAISTQVFTVLPGPNANINPANQNSCAGGNPITIQVTAGGGPGGAGLLYSWSTGTSGSSITVSPSVTTVYSCVVSSTNGCSVTRTSTVTIGSPTVQIVSVPANICPGTTSTLTAGGTGPGPKTFTWSNAIIGNVITSSVAGVFTATMTNGQGCTGVQTYTLGTSTTLSLTATSTPTALCSGNTGTLNVIGASSYTWSNGTTVNNPTINPTSNTTYTVTGQIGTCTGTGAITVSVSVIPTISIVSNPSSICSGASATLNASGADGFTWTPGNLFTTSMVVTPNASTTYSARGVNPGCPARTGTFALQVVPKPNVNAQSSASASCAGEAVALSGSGASTYSWSNGANTSLIIVYPTVNSTYTLTGTSNNCSNSAVVTVTVSDCTGIETQTGTLPLLSVYPNPTSGTFNLKSDAGTSVEILDINGKVTRSYSAIENAGNTMNVTGLTNGLYFIKCSSGKGVKTLKLVVE